MKSYFDLEGDGGSDVMGQVASQKEKIGARLSNVSHLLAVASGKGGVGKSTLSMQLAVILNQLGNKVSLLDADLNGPSLARLSGLRTVALVPGETGLAVPKTASGIGVISLGSVIPETEPIDFESVAKGDSHVWRAAKEFSTLADILEATDWGNLDILIVDLPPGAERCFQFAEFFEFKATFVMVSIPSELSQGVVNRSVAAIRRAGSPIAGYIENMAGYYCAETDEVKPLFPSGNVPIDLPLLGRVPFDPELAECCDKGLTVENMPVSRTAEALREIADLIMIELEK